MLVLLYNFMGEVGAIAIYFVFLPRKTICPFVFVFIIRIAWTNHYISIRCFFLCR